MDVLHDENRDSGDNERWHKKKIYTSAYFLPRSTMQTIDARLGYRAGSDKPLIKWGSHDQGVFSFVTEESLIH